MVYTLNIRPRRQVTLPKSALQKLDLEVGDSLEMKLVGKKAILLPKKQVALDALRELQRIFQSSKTPLKEILADIDRQRRQEAKNA